MTMDAETVFIDTNILVYATDQKSDLQTKSTEKLHQLMTHGVECAISPQIIREYLVVFTRGRSPDDPAKMDALGNVDAFIKSFRLLDESADTVSKLKWIVRNHAVGGKNIHDANIVAVMLTHGVKKLLTHNVDDFRRFGQKIEIMPLLEESL
jgi:predicted nucleic acid-binding protein